MSNPSDEGGGLTLKEGVILALTHFADNLSLFGEARSQGGSDMSLVKGK